LHRVMKGFFPTETLLCLSDKHWPQCSVQVWYDYVSPYWTSNVMRSVVWALVHVTLSVDSSRYVEFVPTRSNTIRSAYLENPILEPNTKSIGWPFAGMWPLEIFKMAASECCTDSSLKLYVVTYQELLLFTDIDQIWRYCRTWYNYW